MDSGGNAEISSGWILIPGLFLAAATFREATFLYAPVFPAFAVFELLAEVFERFGGSLTVLDARFAFRAKALLIGLPDIREISKNGKFLQPSSSGIYLIQDYYII